MVVHKNRLVGLTPREKAANIVAATHTIRVPVNTMANSQPTSLEHALEYTVARLQCELAEKARALEEREHLLRESAAQSRLLFEKNPQPMWIFDLTTLSFLEVNEQAVQHYGYTREEFLSMTLKDIRPVEDVARLLEDVEQTKPSSALAFRLAGQWRHRKKDGTIIHVELSAVPTSFNGRQGVLVLVTDVTKQAQMEDALRQSEQFYRLLIEHFPNGIVALFDHDLRYRIVGGMGLAASGMTKERFEGKLMQEVLSTHTYALIEPYYRKALAGEEAVTEVPYMGRVLLVHTLPIGDEHGNIPVGMVVTQDITRHKRREQRLRRSGQRYRTLAQEREQQLIASDRLVSFGELAASLAHEFNNPLGIAMGFAQDVLSETRPQDRRYRRLQIIVEETRRCGQLMKNLLELAAPPRTTLIATDLVLLIRRSLELIAGRTQKSHIVSMLDCPADLPKMQADPQQLEQVLLNLYFNAIEAMPDGGTLTIQVRSTLIAHDFKNRDHDASAAEMTIAVSDTGQGIAPADIPKIFHSFFTTKKQRGMGLGLSICQSIIRAHNGRITVQSTPGHGTTFILHLPRRTTHHDADI
ncbi:MAG: ATP-binding protein [Candidatus Binatia bacterium]